MQGKVLLVSRSFGSAARRRVALDYITFILRSTPNSKDYFSAAVKS
jgi:hypothetical protein